MQIKPSEYLSLKIISEFVTYLISQKRLFDITNKNRVDHQNITTKRTEKKPGFIKKISFHLHYIEVKNPSVEQSSSAVAALPQNQLRFQLVKLDRAVVGNDRERQASLCVSYLLLLKPELSCSAVAFHFFVTTFPIKQFL